VFELLAVIKRRRRRRRRRICSKQKAMYDYEDNAGAICYSLPPLEYLILHMYLNFFFGISTSAS
jgi:hypothetical protein